MQALAAPFDGAFGFELLEKTLQGDAVIALDVEGAGDLALADFRRRPAG